MEHAEKMKVAYQYKSIYSHTPVAVETQRTASQQVSIGFCATALIVMDNTEEDQQQQSISQVSCNVNPHLVRPRWRLVGAR